MNKERIREAMNKFALFMIGFISGGIIFRLMCFFLKDCP